MAKRVSSVSNYPTFTFATAFLLLSGLSGGNALIGTAHAESSWRQDQGEAMKAARNGNYDDALPVLERLHRQHQADADVTRDYLTVLDWSGHDEQVVSLFKTLPDDHEPDYVLLAAGHAYRLAGKLGEAQAIYHKGQQLYPENADFTAGEIRVLLELHKFTEAAQLSSIAVAKPAKSQELNTVIEEARHVYAISEAREGRYPEALKILDRLHQAYPNDIKLTRDYIAVMAWSGDDKGAVTLFQTLPLGSDQPEFIFAAVGKSYRNLGQTSEAAALYHEALQHYPSNKDFQIGEVDSLIDEGNDDEAAALVQSPPFEQNTVAQEKIKHRQETIKQAQETEKKRVLQAQQDQAATLARSGKYKEATEILNRLIKDHPTNLSLRQDYMAVLSWSRRDKDAIHAYETYGNGHVADYVLAAIGHSYRSQKDFPKALALYNRGENQAPGQEVFAVGAIGTLIDMGRFVDAQRLAEKKLKSLGSRLNILILAAYAADANNDIFDSLIYAHRAVALDPTNPAALRAEIHAERRVGAADAANELAENTRAATESDRIEIVGDTNANLVRWGKLEPISYQERYKVSDQALQTLDRQITTDSQQDRDSTPQIMRARFDRIVALRDRSRMQEVVEQYVQLRDQGVKVPAYALGPVGDAYLYLRQPEAARDVYLEALQTVPDDFEIRRQLYFAYVECNDFDHAYATIDKLRDDQAIWYYLKGEPERLPNPNRAMAEIDSANARVYAGELEDANERLKKIASSAPYDVHNKEALGSLYLTRGWPRLALQEFRLGTRVQDGLDVGTDTGAALATFDMRDYPAAETALDKLGKDYPESLDVQRAIRQFGIYNMAELHVDSFYNSRSSNNEGGGAGYGLDTELFSAPIDYNWRLFAGSSYAHEKEPNDEGSIGFVQTRAGVEYRDVNLIASAAPTFNAYHATTHVGIDGKGEWTFNDIWTAGVGYQSFANDTPLRAMNDNVTSSKYSGNVEWRQSESREVRFDGEVMPFSDGNTRVAGAASYSERLYTDPKWRIDGLVDTDMSHNSGAENRNYYNPKLDVTGLAGARLTQTLSRRYEDLYEHSLQLSPGLYWQESHGTRPAWTAVYQQTLHLDDKFEGSASINYAHQAYDGVQEDNVSFTISLVDRF